MKVAMAVLALRRAVRAASSRSRASTTSLDNFLEPTFADSPLAAIRAHRRRSTWLGLVVGAVIASPASRSPTGSTSRRPGHAGARCSERFARAAQLPRQQVVLRRADRPRSSSGRSRGSAASARDSFERVVVNGGSSAAPTGVVRAGSAAVRALQTGFVRSYALLLVAGLAGARPLLPAEGRMSDPPDPSSCWLPLAAGLLALLRAARARRAGSMLARRAASRSASRSCSSPTSTPAPPGLQYVDRRAPGSPTLGIHYKLGVDGLNVFLVLLTTRAVVARRPLWSALPRAGAARTCFFLLGARRDRRCSARSSPRTCCCSSSSST